VSTALVNNWPTKRLRFLTRGAITENQRQILAGASQVNFVPMEAVGDQGELDLSLVREIEEVRSGYTQFFEGDVVLAKITPCFENGKGALIRGTASGVGFGTTELHVLTPTAEVDGRFLYYVTVSSNFRKLGEASMMGAAGQKRVPEDFVRDFRIAVPPLDQQQAIVDYLDRETARLDSMVAAKERLLDLLAEKRWALITRVVTRGLDPRVPLRDSGIPWLGEVPKHWETPPVYSRFEVQLGKMLDEKKIKGTHLAPYLRNVDVQWRSINTADLPEMDFDDEDRVRYSLRAGDILVCEGGEVGRCAIWTGELDECYYQKALHRLRSVDGRDEASFFIFVMSTLVESGIFSSQASASTIQHLPAEKLRVVRYPAPPLSEQRAIVAHISAEIARLDGLRSATERTISLLKERRAALIAAAVTGQINLGGPGRQSHVGISSENLV
jgi:type I restriction enzyme S subunit